jgi:hypothetical protein
MKEVSFFRYILSRNRKFHIYAGLLLLLFIWLFSLSGLLLNHSQWKFAGFWEQRKETEKITPVEVPFGSDSIQTINKLMHQLKISGEISNITSNTGSLDFRVTKPGTVRNIRIDLINKISTQKITVFNIWGKIKTLHTLNGVNKATPDIRPNWIVTRIWRTTMDIIAFGLIFLCISSWIMWYEVRMNYSKGVYVLILGLTGAIYFIFLI